MNRLKKKGMRLVFAAAFVAILASCTSNRVAVLTERVRVIRNQEDMNALLGFNGDWSMDLAAAIPFTFSCRVEETGYL